MCLGCVDVEVTPALILTVVTVGLLLAAKLAGWPPDDD